MFHLALAGKGGSGKSTLAALVVRRLAAAGRGVLAVDADPNSCLGRLLGVTVARTVADLREDFRSEKRQPPPGVSRPRALEYELGQALQEEEGFDLLTMGRPEGASCYCAVNNLLREYFARLHQGYAFVVSDNEAGMEHLSRRTTDNVDLLLAVAEPTRAGLEAVERIYALLDTLPSRVRRRALVLNKVSARGAAPALRPLLERLGERAELPWDEELLRLAEEGRPLSELPAAHPAARAVDELCRRWQII